MLVDSLEFGGGGVSINERKKECLCLPFGIVTPHFLLHWLQLSERPIEPPPIATQLQAWL